MFLSVVTRVYQRPICLLNNVTSIARQDCTDYEQLFLVDESGQGMQYANEQFHRHCGRVHGDYVYMLDDDDMLTRDDAVGLFRQAAEANPELIVCKFDVEGHGEIPDRGQWRREPKHSHIGTPCMVVRCDLWQRFIRHFGQPIAGDFAFISALWPHLSHIVWLDVCVGKTQRVSRGKPE
jgi:hypothetical protein